MQKMQDVSNTTAVVINNLNLLPLDTVLETLSFLPFKEVTLDDMERTIDSQLLSEVYCRRDGQYFSMYLNIKVLSVIENYSELEVVALYCKQAYNVKLKWTRGSFMTHIVKMLKHLCPRCRSITFKQQWDGTYFKSNILMRDKYLLERVSNILLEKENMNILDMSLFSNLCHITVDVLGMQDYMTPLTLCDSVFSVKKLTIRNLMITSSELQAFLESCHFNIVVFVDLLLDDGGTDLYSLDISNCKAHMKFKGWPYTNIPFQCSFD
jgi:hypothetical protein